MLQSGVAPGAPPGPGRGSPASSLLIMSATKDGPAASSGEAPRLPLHPTCEDGDAADSPVPRGNRRSAAVRSELPERPATPRQRPGSAAGQGGCHGRFLRVYRATSSSAARATTSPRAHRPRPRRGTAAARMFRRVAGQVGHPRGRRGLRDGGAAGRQDRHGGRVRPHARPRPAEARRRGAHRAAVRRDCDRGAIPRSAWPRASRQCRRATRPATSSTSERRSRAALHMSREQFHELIQAAPTATSATRDALGGRARGASLDDAAPAAYSLAMVTATFRFYEELNDFLAPARRAARVRPARCARRRPPST